MIIVVAYPGEDHSAEVVPLMRAQGEEVVEMDLSNFPLASPLIAQWSEPKAPQLHCVLPDGKRVNLYEADAVWWRRVRPFSVAPQIARAEHRSFAQSETEQAVLGVLESLSCFWMNPMQADAAAHHKPRQWTLARACGLQLPRTLVTTDPDAARQFLAEQGQRKTVFKPFLATINDWRETRLVEPQDLDKLDLLRLAPVIFQDYVDGVDLRITIVGDTLYPVEIDVRQSSYPCDMRMSLGEAKTKAVTLPKAVEEKLLALQSMLGLRYGAVDMRRNDKGEYLFLEVNPAGQWLFAQRHSGLNISQGVADYLVRQAQQVSKQRQSSLSHNTAHEYTAKPAKAAAVCTQAIKRRAHMSG